LQLELLGFIQVSESLQKCWFLQWQSEWQASCWILMPASWPNIALSICAYSIFIRCQIRSYTVKMKSRRNFFAFLTAFFLGVAGKARTPSTSGVKELARHALTGPQEELEAILVEVTALPGAPSTVHRHPGFVLGYVLDGEMKFAINGAIPEVVKTGGTFFEPLGALHTTGASAKSDSSVKFLAFIVAPKGSPVALPA
jgi:quercetin dioxygenase-like cupin family protein